MIRQVHKFHTRVKTSSHPPFLLLPVSPFPPPPLQQLLASYIIPVCLNIQIKLTDNKI